MSIKLNNTTYDRVLDEDGLPLVIRHVRGHLWRVASPAASLIVLAGLVTPPVRA